MYTNIKFISVIMGAAVYSVICQSKTLPQMPSQLLPFGVDQALRLLQ